MYYFAFITFDYLQKAELALHSFFYYNDVTLNLFVVDSNYDKIYRYYEDKSYKAKLNLINAYDKNFYNHILSYNYTHPYLQPHIANIILSSFRILDLISNNEIIRVDLDAMYLAPLNFLENYKVSLAGMQEDDSEYIACKKYHYPNHTKLPIINIGIAKYTKDKFKLENSFTNTMFEKLDNDFNNYLIPDQDILNEISPDRLAITENIISPCKSSNENTSKEIKAIHYNGLLKPWENNEENVPTHFNTAATYMLCEVFAKKYNYFSHTINKTVTAFRKILFQKNLTAIQQNYINKLIKLRSEVSNW